MGQSRFIDVEVTVTSTVMYRRPRPTKAEVVDAGHEWESDDPEGSIQSYLESEGIQDRIQGFRPINVTVEEMEIADVMPAGKGLKPEEARPVFKIKATFKTKDGQQKEGWFKYGRWLRAGEENTYTCDILTKDDCIQMAEPLRKFDAKKIVEKYSPGGVEYDPMTLKVQMIPYQVKL